jgi:spore coat protein U-like protein
MVLSKGENMKHYKSIAIFSLSLILSLTGNIARAAGTSTANPKATAVISSSCQISAQNLAFGNLVLPISAQSASSTMTVLCSKNAAYTIGLAYGGVYGTTSQNVTATYNLTGYTSGNGYTYQTCLYSATYDGNTYTKSVGNNGNAPWGYCPTTSGTKVISTASVYTYGKMIGVAKGDNVAYSIQVPNQPSQIWNAGNYNYTGTGTGLNQTLPVVGTLVPAQTSNNYPSPDMYVDTVTATVSF